MTFRKPYNTNLVAGFDESWNRMESHQRRRDAFSSKWDDKVDDETRAAIVDLTKQGAGWAEEINKKNQHAQAAEDFADHYLGVLEGKSAFDQKKLENRANQEAEINRMGVEDREKQRQLQETKGISFVEGNDLRYTHGVRSFDLSKSIIKDKMGALSTHLETTFGSAGQIGDPNKEYTIENTGRTFKLGDPDVTYAELRYARIQELKNFILANPELANAPLTHVAQYFPALANNQKIWEKNTIIALDTKRVQTEFQLERQLWHDNGRTDLSKVFAEASLYKINGVQIGYNGAMTLFQEDFLTRVEAGEENRANWELIGQTPISKGHKGYGINKQTGKLNTYADVYPNRFGNGVEGLLFKQKIIKAENKSTAAYKAWLTADNDRIDKEKAEEFAEFRDDKGNLPTDKRFELEKFLTEQQIEHGDRFKGSRIKALLEQTKSNKTTERAAWAEEKLQKLEARFALTEDDIDFAYQHLPIDDADKWKKRIEKYVKWQRGDTYTKAQEGMNKTFNTKVYQINTPREVTGIESNIVDHLKAEHTKLYFQHLNNKENEQTFENPTNAAELANIDLNTYITEQKQEGGLLYQDPVKKGGIGVFDNFIKFQLKRLDPEEYKRVYGNKQAAIELIKDSEGDMEVAKLTSQSTGIPLYNLYSDLTGETSPMEIYNNNVSTSVLSYAIRNPQSSSAQARALHDMKAGAETISNNYDPDIDPLGKAALILTNQDSGDGYFPEDGETAKEFLANNIDPSQLIMGYATNADGTLDLIKVRTAKRVLYACGAIGLQECSALV